MAVNFAAINALADGGTGIMACQVESLAEMHAAVERLEREIAALSHQLHSPSRSAEAYAQRQLPVLEAQVAEARARLILAEADLLVAA